MTQVNQSPGTRCGSFHLCNPFDDAAGLDAGAVGGKVEAPRCRIDVDIFLLAGDDREVLLERLVDQGEIELADAGVAAGEVLSLDPEIMGAYVDGLTGWRSTEGSPSVNRACAPCGSTSG